MTTPHRELAERIHIASCVIARAWRSYSRRLTFCALKQALYKAERSVTFEILRKLAPKEAELLKDPTIQVRVRFRFAGASWPPKIQFKIFTKGNNVHYFSGHRVIQPGSKAAFDSCRVMGARLYSELLIREESQSMYITDPYEVTNRMEFVKYVNAVDYRPPHLGGRNNGWRDLSLSAFASQNVFFDVNIRREKAIIESRRRYVAKRSLRLAEATPTEKPRAMTTHDMEDDFGALFEWTNALTFDDLKDFIAL